MNRIVILQHAFSNIIHAAASVRINSSADGEKALVFDPQRA